MKKPNEKLNKKQDINWDPSGFSESIVVRTNPVTGETTINGVQQTSVFIKLTIGDYHVVVNTN